MSLRRVEGAEMGGERYADHLWRMAARFPDRLFVEDRDLRLTFAEAARIVRVLADALLASTPADRPVAALVDNGVVNSIALLACLAAGRTSVPIDLGAPTERRSVIMREAGIAAAIALPGTTIDLDDLAGDATLLFVDLAPDGSDVPAPPPQKEADWPAVLAFTSGSTGTPKGVAMSETQSLFATRQHVEACAIDADAVLLSFSSTSPFSLRDVGVAVMTGASLHFADIKQQGFAECLRQWRRVRATHIAFVPSAMRVVAGLPGAGEAMRHLRVLSLGGEPTTAADIALFQQAMSASARIAIAMGSSESNVLTSWLVDPACLTTAVAPVGYILPERTVAIVDEDGVEVAEGEVGELIVSDEHVPLGYWRKGQLVEAFRARPGEPGPRTCRTGDLVRRRADGLIEHCGRNDTMVKVRGLRVDLAEVEAALRSYPGVDDAVVAPNREGDGETRLTAFVVWHDGKPASILDVRRHVASTAAEHMVPHAFIDIASIPRLHNDKPDMVQLQAFASEPRRS